jgi:hypothetical protein
MMSKSNQLTNEFLKVDTQAGKLRLALFLIGIFIVWSLLAIFVSIYNPLPSLPSLWIFNSSQSTSLASDVLNDILSNYFSAFSLINLSIFLLIVYGTYRSVSWVMANAYQLSKEKSAKRYIKSCSFSIPAYPVITPAGKEFTRTDDFKIITNRGGPCFLKLEVDQIAIIQNQIGNLQILHTDQPQSESFFIDHQTKLIQILPVEEEHTRLTVHAICRDNQRIKLKDLRVTYAHPLAQNQPAENLANKDGLQYQICIYMFQDLNWKKFIDECLVHEIQSCLLEYSSVEIRQHSGIVNPQRTSPTLSGALPSNKSHAVPGHGKRYPVPNGFFKWQTQGGFLRRRRRSLLPEIRHYPTIESQSVEPEITLEDILSEYLTNTFKSIYNNLIINLEVESRGEISFNDLF